MNATTMVVSETITLGLSMLDLQRDAFESIDRTLHDLGQPLTSIALALELIAQEPDRAACQQMLQAARTECNRAMRDVAELRQHAGNLLVMMNKAKEEQA